MNSTGWIIVSALWVVVLVQSLLLYALLREIGRERLSRVESIERDGIPAGKRLPEVRTASERLRDHHDLRVVFAGQRYVLLCALPDCEICPRMVDYVRDAIDEHVSMAVLIDPIGIRDYEAKYENVFGAEEVVFRNLQVRAYPFIFVLDEESRVVSRGLAGTGGDAIATLRAGGVMRPTTSSHNHVSVTGLPTRRERE